MDENYIAERIHFIRGEKVMLDSDLAILYGVETRTLNQAVSRNKKRFPSDCMYVLTLKETRSLTSQSVMSKRGGRRHTVHAFTEQGVAMLSSVLKSERAIEVSIAIMRTFIRMRQLLLQNEGLLRRLHELELSVQSQFAEHDHKFALLFEAIKQLMREEEKPKRQIGFLAPEE